VTYDRTRLTEDDIATAMIKAPGSGQIRARVARGSEEMANDGLRPIATARDQRFAAKVRLPTARRQ
jgi:hypothetical protein